MGSGFMQAYVGMLLIHGHTGLLAAHGIKVRIMYSCI